MTYFIAVLINLSLREIDMFGIMLLLDIYSITASNDVSTACKVSSQTW